MTERFNQIPAKGRNWLLALLSLTLCFLCFSTTLTASAVSPFIKHTGEVNIGNIRGAADSWVIWDEADSIYKMWFTHPRTDVSPSQVSSLITGIELQAVLDALKAQDIDALLNHISSLNAESIYDMLAESATVIGYATSNDGINWNVVNPEVLTAGEGNDLQNVGAPCVIKDGEGYYMWYTRSTTDYTLAELEEVLANLASETDEEVVNAILDLIAGNCTVIDYATSSDGINWSVDNTEVLIGDTAFHGDNVAAPCVLKFGDGDYRMWFSNVSTGITQTDIEYLVENKETVTTEELWELQAGVTGSIGYATSADGITWTDINRNVFSGGTGALNAVGAPCVVYNEIDYEMWYTYGVTDLTREDVDTIIDELEGIDFDPLIALMEDEDYDGLIEALSTIIDNDIPQTKTLLEGTATKIGYASSSDGISEWTVDNTYGLTGSSTTPWGSVARPCVIEADGVYQMWFTKGIEELTSQNLVNLWQGEISTIGYASNGTILELASGWNFIGLPVAPVDTATEEVLNNILAGTRNIWNYDASTQLWNYFTTIEGAPQGALTEMIPGDGYWIEIENPVSLLLFGAEPAYPFEIELVTGWNMISIPKTPASPQTEEVLSEILGNVRNVWTYDASTQLWEYFTTIQDAPQGGLTEMIEGQAYWIEMTADGTLVIN